MFLNVGICELLSCVDTFPILIDSKLVPLRKRLVAKLIGYCKLCRLRPSGFKGEVNLYVVYCRRHRVYFIDYPHGFTEYFTCPLCLKEELEERRGKMTYF